ncbi:hypothetical protein [Tanticharoenia sakaeratensis]|jgi:hypothetical protein|uniref:Uncharacterized protein n=1 Tax=Tanticharoenia sakaeratensis NBRC 103193 TaxID=1231623 RepID=A0A0D6MKC5_9PROT|nr:hypothetical protein [Tanticharoenia sakaeratensis]GAN53728.1 hypothetical protein Tasa_010_275 [Tanticharoenia sakaeratensis NBRC 103193]GBQ17075.1 hypothetical protein AA103193_0211 [Tanticharoenia sakaeratensis NBRC 103193]
MIRKLALVFASAAIMASTSLAAHAAPCRDAKGKFTKCETVKKPTKCRDAKGKFTKCSTAGANPA